MEHFSEAVRGNFNVVRDVPENHQNYKTGRKKVKWTEIPRNKGTSSLILRFVGITVV